LIIHRSFMCNQNYDSKHWTSNRRWKVN